MDLRHLYALDTSPMDFDRYETRQLLAVDRWARANPDRKLEIRFAGHGPLEQPIREHLLPDNVELTIVGAVNYGELHRIYGECGIFVLPTLADEWGIVVNEAMAAGLPIITTSDPGCRALVGDAAILVPPRDPAALAEAITRLAGDENLRRELGEAGRRRAMEHYSWRSVVDRYREIYAQHAR